MLLRHLLTDGWQVVRPNTRGVASEPQAAGYGALQLEDTHRLLEHLGLDPRHTAVIGHSHGAAMAYYYATHSDRFCGVAAINGRADWIMQAEYESDGLLPGPMGATPAQGPARYREASPAANARSVKAPMLLVGGRDDTQILPANVTTMADSLARYGRSFERLLFEDEGHQIDRPTNREALLDAIRRLLATGCGG